jgi:hypothetical protein
MNGKSPLTLGWDGDLNVIGVHQDELDWVVAVNVEAVLGGSVGAVRHVVDDNLADLMTHPGILINSMGVTSVSGEQPTKGCAIETVHA